MRLLSSVVSLRARILSVRCSLVFFTDVRLLVLVCACRPLIVVLRAAPFLLIQLVICARRLLVLSPTAFLLCVLHVFPSNLHNRLSPINQLATYV